MEPYNTRARTKALKEQTAQALPTAAIVGGKKSQKRKQKGPVNNPKEPRPDTPAKKPRVFHGVESNHTTDTDQTSQRVGPKTRKPIVKTETEAAEVDSQIDAKLSQGLENGRTPDAAITDGEPSTMPQDDGDDSPKKQPNKSLLKGFTPGVSPFPDWEGPAKNACQEVFRLLDQHHEGEVKHRRPENIPAPSLEVAGCGEVESVLDALLRTYLSGATTMSNANQAIQGLHQKFGTVSEGDGKGSIDWNAVRLGTHADLMGAIRPAGLAQKKSTCIKEILDLVQRDNLSRADEILGEKQTGTKPRIAGGDTEPQSEKDKEIQRVERSILSLQHLRCMSKNEAIVELVKFKGIGVKTAACVALFCLQKDCFAVDTHVHRFCKWLGWVPSTATEIQTFNHCEVHVPDEVKYALHQLFIIHGQECHRCKASTCSGTKEWNECVCPLEHLLKRGKPQSATVKIEAGTTPITNFFSPTASNNADTTGELQPLADDD